MTLQKPYILNKLDTLTTDLADIAINVKSYGADPTGVNDSTSAIQSAIDGLARGYGRHVYIPAGVYKITSTLIVPSYAHIYGAGSQPGDFNQGGTELQWHGADGGTAIITAVDDNSDWGKGLIQDIRIKNYTASTSGWGLKVRNPQNGSRLKNVHVSNFPTMQCLVYEATPNPRGSSPGFFYIEDGCFFIGGQVPLEIEQGVEQVNVSNTGIDTDANSTMGCLVSAGDWAGASSSSQRWALKFDSCKIEIQQASADIPGFKITVDSPITFNTCTIQRNDNITSTKQAIWYTNPGNRKLPTIEIINCTTWNLAKGFEATEASLLISPSAINTPYSFSYRRNSTDTPQPFVYFKIDVAAGLSGSGVKYGNITDIESAGITMPRNGMLIGMSARVNAAITQGSITPKAIKNGSNLIDTLTLNSSNQQAYEDFNSTNALSSFHHFSAGDRIGVYVDTSSDLLPTGSVDLTVTLFIRFY